MARAKKLGFVIRAFHGTGTDFHEFSLDKGRPNRSGGHGPMFSDVAGEASGYAERKYQNDQDGNVIPVLLRLKNPFTVDYGDKTIPKEQFLKLTGGAEGYFFKQTTNFSSRDVMDAVFKHFSDLNGDGRMAWSLVYQHFRKMGYDGFLFPNVPRDFEEENPDTLTHTKLVVFDPKNVRSIFAAFDPSKSESANLLS